MFPPTYTFFPASFKNSAMMVVVVVFPSLPVTPMSRPGQVWKNTSISELRAAPRWTASSSSGVLGLRPGVRKISSSGRSFR